jgi:hypothetical protein
MPAGALLLRSNNHKITQRACRDGSKYNTAIGTAQNTVQRKLEVLQR